MASSRRILSSLGSLTCSSCGENIDMSALEDHVCAAPTKSKPLPQPTRQIPPSDPAIQQGAVAGLFQLPSRLPEVSSILPAPAFLRWGKPAPLEIDSDTANRVYAAQRLSSDSDNSDYSRSRPSLAPTTPSTQLTSPSSMFSRNPYSRTSSPPSPGLHSIADSTYLSKYQPSGSSETGIAKFRKGVSLLQKMNVADGPFTGKSHSRSTSRDTSSTKEVEPEPVKARPSFRNAKGREHFRMLSTNQSPTLDGFRERLQSSPLDRRPTRVDDIDTFLREVESESPFKSHNTPPVPPKDESSFWNSSYEGFESEKQEVVSQATDRVEPSTIWNPEFRGVDNSQDPRPPPLQVSRGLQSTWNSEAIGAEDSRRDGSPPSLSQENETRPFWNPEFKGVDNLRDPSTPPVQDSQRRQATWSSDFRGMQISLQSSPPSSPTPTDSRPLWNPDFMGVDAPRVENDLRNRSPVLAPLDMPRSVTPSQRVRRPSASDSGSNYGSDVRRPSADTNRSDSRIGSESPDVPRAGGFRKSQFTDPAIQMGLDTPQPARSHSSREQNRLYNGGLYSRRPSTTRQYEQPHQAAIAPTSNPQSGYGQKQMSLPKRIPEEEPAFSSQDGSLSREGMFREPVYERQQPTREPSAPRQAMMPIRQSSTKTGPLDGISRASDIARSNTAPLPSAARQTCRGCNIVIAGRSVRDSSGRLSGRYHRTCFTCTTCSAPFPTGDFYVIDNAPFCQRHYHERNGTLCSSCHTGIEGRYLETEPKKMFHVECFGCAKCGIALSEEYWELGGVQYCQRHAFARNEYAARDNGRPWRDPEKRKTRFGMMYV